MTLRGVGNMVDSEEFKNKIESIISQDYKVEYLGKDFDQIVKNYNLT